MTKKNPPLYNIGDIVTYQEFRTYRTGKITYLRDSLVHSVPYRYVYTVESGINIASVPETDIMPDLTELFSL